MVIYNVTVNVDQDIHDDWLEWMKTHHIPEVMGCGLFIWHKIFKVVGDDAGFTYAIQYATASMADLEEYQRVHAPRLQQTHRERYGDSAVAFRSVMEELE